MFEQRWPQIVLTDVANAEPTSRITVDDAAALARAHSRGIEPIRIFIPQQIVATVDQECWDDQPMPMVLLKAGFQPGQVRRSALIVTPIAMQGTA